MAIGDVKIVSVTGTEPVTLAEVKNRLRITVDTADDALLTSQITAAREIAEAYLMRDIVAKERVQFIKQDIAQTGEFELYYAPIAAVATVKIEGVAQTENEGFELIGLSDNPCVKLNNPFAREIEITYSTIGLNNGIIKQGILAIIESLYECGEAGMGYRSILAPLKKIWI